MNLLVHCNGEKNTTSQSLKCNKTKTVSHECSYSWLVGFAVFWVSFYKTPIYVDMKYQYISIYIYIYTYIYSRPRDIIYMPSKYHKLNAKKLWITNKYLINFEPFCWIYSGTYKKYIFISCHVSTLKWHRYLTYSPKEDKKSLIVLRKHHSCWGLGDG